MKRNVHLLKPLKIGDDVQWNWMGHKIQGTVKKIYLKPVTQMRDGKPFTRNGSPEKPAYLVKSAAGSQILKLHSELKALRI